MVSLYIQVEFSVFGVVVRPMLEATNLRSSIKVGACFLWKLKIFGHFRLSCLIIFVGLGTEEMFTFFVCILEALCKVSNGAGNFVPGIFVLFCNFYNFVTKKLMSFYLPVIMVIYFCIASVVNSSDSPLGKIFLCVLKTLL